MNLDELEKAARAAAQGIWTRCHHLDSAEKDASCPCGYRGGIWGADGEHIVCEMGSYETKGEEGMAPPRYSRDKELANAAHIVAASPEPILTLARAFRLACAANAIYQNPDDVMDEYLKQAERELAEKTRRDS